VAAGVVTADVVVEGGGGGADSVDAVVEAVVAGAEPWAAVLVTVTVWVEPDPHPASAADAAHSAHTPSIRFTIGSLPRLPMAAKE
jgi:hypothetical protein